MSQEALSEIRIDSPAAQSVLKAQKADNDSRIAAALEVAAKHKAETGSATPSQDAQITRMNGEVNATLSQLAKIKQPGESDEAAVLRIREGSDPIAKGIAQRAVNAQMQFAMEMRGRENVRADQSTAEDDNVVAETKQSRTQEVRNLARQISKDEGIDLSTAFNVAMFTLQTDGNEAIPRFAAQQARAQEHFDSKYGTGE